MIIRVRKTVLMASMLLSTAAGFLEDGGDRSRELQNLLTRYDITEPSFDYDSSSIQFSLNWKINDAIQDKNIVYSVYQGHACKTGSGNGGDIDITATSDEYLYTPGIQASSLTPFVADPAISGSGQRDISLHLSIQSNKIASSPIYTEGLNGQNVMVGNVKFCVRFGVLNGRDAPDSLEVNFIESLVDFNAYLTDGFEIADLSVVPKLKGEETATDQCEVVAYECDEQNQELQLPGVAKNQGSEVRVCVTLSDESKSIGLFLNRITWFYFYRETLDGTGDIDVRQDSIFDDAIVDPQGLTMSSCEPGDELCVFSTILKAAFFNVPGTVLGTGEAICQFGDGTGDWSPPTSAPTQVVALAPTDEPLFSKFDCEGHAVLAGSAITFADTTISGGDVNAGTAIDGTLTSLVGGEVLTTGAFSIPQLGLDILSAVVAAAAERDGAQVFGIEIGGQTFTAGTWRSGTLSMAAGTTVTLDGQGDPNSVFLLQAGTTMTVAAGCTILLVNEAKAENVLWSVGTLTTGESTIMEGNIIASSVVTFGANNEVTGSIVAGSAITFGADNVMAGCAVAGTRITFGADNFLTVVQDSPDPSAPTEVVALAPTDEPLFSEFDCEGHAVLAGSAITFADTTISGGDVNKGTAIDGILTSLVGGELLTTVFDIPLLGLKIMSAVVAAAAERDGAQDFGGIEIGGGTFTAGTWRSGTLTMAAGTTVTLDGGNDPNSVFLLQAGTTMTVGAGCMILLVNEAKAENVLWSVGALTTGERTIMEGNIIASSAITFGADNVITGGSIVAGSAITFGADNDIGSCVVANTAITFGADNFVTVVQEGPSCGSEVILVDISDTNIPFPEGAIAIDGQAGTSVTFTVRQKWDATNAISWIATMYPSNPDGANVCPVDTAAAPDAGVQYTATCFNEMSSPIRVFVQVATDGSGDQVVVPEGCDSTSLVAAGGMVEYEISIPCLPCAGAQALRSRYLSVNSSPTNRDSSPSFKSLLSETALHHSRALQEAAAPFELAEFQVNKGVDTIPDSAFSMTLSAHAFLALSFTLAFAMFG